MAHFFAGVNTQVARILVNRVRLERTRQFGGGFLGWELWKRLGLDSFFEQLMDEEATEVPWSRVAAVLAINRLCAPGSELAIEERWYPSTALDDLLEIEEGKINDTRLYRCLDRMLPHKTKLEQHLKQRYGELFGAEFDVLLYDRMSNERLMYSVGIGPPEEKSALCSLDRIRGGNEANEVD